MASEDVAAGEGALRTGVSRFLPLTPHAAAEAGLAALALREKGASATAAVAGTALSVTVAPRAITRRQPAAAGSVLRVLTVNLDHGRAAGAELISLVHGLRADVLFLQELTDDAAMALESAGLSQLLPSQMRHSRGYRYRGSAIYARYRLGDGLVIGPSFAPQPTARLDFPCGRSAQMVCIHRSSVPTMVPGSSPPLAERTGRVASAGGPAGESRRRLQRQP
jgi:Endonuclease/Exonuclease/phosphatase family